MSVLSHLTDTASSIVLSDTEKGSIQRSIKTIENRLDSYFGQELSLHFTFGSHTRETILPRKIDSSSDVDYMIVFKDNSYKPQTYLDRLKRFVEYYYSTSEISQSFPVIALDLEHIKFELVPAILDWGMYKIPSTNNYTGEWMSTDPIGFNSSLIQKNVDNNYQIKPLIRIIKYWNALNGVFTSFPLEKYIVDKWYFSCNNVKDYVYSVFESIELNQNASQTSKNKLQRAKDVISATKLYENNNMPYTAESEIKKIFPVIP
ncbi:hypothetical protein Dform_02042 [Dehalogenimonas formicexedens]|uniref:Nucleotidyltransferase domain-containing protein n=1 Tax=Dehalogenimonas formicexedens TaxID=1839801 RepID=A0A1P8FA80_9CHLR|nr:nucleotidyltransferase [Dehalogenimonas formicexedens]APV45351.1 hypothetical protein Dform_02042 [Dehalogenimonas formicexedens]